MEVLLSENEILQAIQVKYVKKQSKKLVQLEGF